MSTLDYEFDPTGVSVANKITGETQAIDITKNVMVMPVNHPFFAESLSEITVTDGTNIKTLYKGEGYVLSPLFLEAGARCTGKLVNTYIIIIDKESEWTGVSMDYQTLGGYQDTFLLTELNGITFDTSKATQWLKIKGGAGFYDVYQRGGRLANRTMMDVFAEGLDNISNNLLSPPGSNKAWGQRISELEKQVDAILPDEDDNEEVEVLIGTSSEQNLDVIDEANFVIDRVTNLNVSVTGKTMTMVVPTYSAGNRSTTTLPGGYFSGTVTSDKGYPWWKRTGDLSVMCRVNGRWFLYAPGLSYCYVTDNSCELPTLASGWSAYDLVIDTNLIGEPVRQKLETLFVHHNITLNVPTGFNGEFTVGDFMGSSALGYNAISAPYHIGLPAPVGLLSLTDAGVYTQFTVNAGKIRSYSSGTTKVISDDDAGVVVDDPLIGYTKIADATIQFTNPGNRSGTWLFGDAKSTTDKNPIHKYETEGSFLAKFTDTTGKEQTIGPIVIDVDLPEPVFTHTFNAATPNVITFKALGAETYSWSINGATYSTVNPTVVFTVAGVYEVVLTGYNAVGVLVRYTNSINVSMPNRAPIVSLGYSVNDLQVTFASTVSDESTVSYSYNFGDGSAISTQANPVHTYAVGGSYTVTLNVTDVAGLKTQKTIILSVVKPNVAPVVILAHTTNNLVASFNSTVVDEDEVIYRYDFGDSIGTSTVADPTYTYSEDGTYTVTLTVTDSRGASVITTEEVTVIKENVNPVVSLGYSTNALSVTFSPTVVDEDDVTYSYNFGDGNTSTEINPVHVYADTGEYGVVLTVTDSRGGVGSSTATVSVIKDNVSPVVSFEYSATNLVADFTSTVVDDDEVTYSYNFGDGNTSTQANPTHTYADSGNYAVVLTVTDSRGGVTTHTDTVSVIKANTAPVVSLAHSKSDLVVNFTSTVTDEDSVTYVYDFGDNSGTSVVANPTHAYADSGTYNVTLTVTDSRGASSIVSETVSVVKANVNPVVSLSHTKNNLVVNFTSTVTDDDAVTYAYDFGDSSTSTQANPVHTYAVGGSYTVTLTVTDARGGVEVVTNTVSVVKANTAPVVTLSYVANELVVDFTSTVVDEDAVTYAYNFGDSSGTSMLANPTHTYASNGTYTVTLTVSDSRGATTVKTVEVTVELGITADYDYATNGLSVEFIAVPVTSELVDYRYDFGDGTDLYIGDNPTHVFAESGTYEVTMTVSDEDGTDYPVTKSITVSNTAKQKFGWYTTAEWTRDTEPQTNTAPEVGLGYYVNERYVEFVSDVNDETSVTYSYNFGDGNTSTQANPTHTYADEGIYNATLTVTDTEGLSTVVTRSIDISDGAVFRYDMTWSEAPEYYDS